MEHNREQIIKALECLTGEPMFCRECAYNGVGAFSCRKDLAKDALSLIKELTEENERLRAELAERPPKLIITRLPKGRKNGT